MQIYFTFLFTTFKPIYLLFENYIFTYLSTNKVHLDSILKLLFYFTTLQICALANRSTIALNQLNERTWISDVGGLNFGPGYAGKVLR